jgi:rubrerythrin
LWDEREEFERNPQRNHRIYSVVTKGISLKEVGAGTVFKKKKEVWWVCRECGYVHFGKEPPEKCPSCDHERSFYQVKCEEY